jgi:hypothetical protein
MSRGIHSVPMAGSKKIHNFAIPHSVTIKQHFEMCYLCNSSLQFFDLQT